MRMGECHSERSEESLLKGLKRDSSLHFVPFRMTKPITPDKINCFLGRAQCQAPAENDIDKGFKILVYKGGKGIAHGFRRECRLKVG